MEYRALRIEQSTVVIVIRIALVLGNDPMAVVLRENGIGLCVW